MTPDNVYDRHAIVRDESAFRTYFGMVLFTTLLPYLGAIFPFLPQQFLGFNWTGIAWVLMLLTTIPYLLRYGSSTFPIAFWLPWLIYMVGYIVVDFSFLGLQLTLQYTLPILVGIVVSTFAYDSRRLRWMFSQFLKLVGVVYALFVFYTVLYGFTPAMAATPMLFSVMGVVLLALYFQTRKWQYAIGFFLLMLMPVTNTTRMGIAVFLAIYLVHFGNRGIRGRIVAGFIGTILLVTIFNMPTFQEKTFRYGTGTFADLSLDYYDNNELNNSGRTSWLLALEVGLQQEPVWGNGPRADNEALRSITGAVSGEAHNDYLSVRYNYGYVGLGLLLYGFAGTFWSLFRGFRRYREPYFQIVVTSSLTLFASFLLFMYSDNILKYTIYFPHYFFALVGIASSMYQRATRLQ